MTLIFLQPPSSSPSTMRPDPRCSAPSGGNPQTHHQTPNTSASATTSGSYNKELLSCQKLLLRHTHTPTTHPWAYWQLEPKGAEGLMGDRFSFNWMKTAELWEGLKARTDTHMHTQCTHKSTPTYTHTHTQFWLGLNSLNQSADWPQSLLSKRMLCVWLKMWVRARVCVYHWFIHMCKHPFHQ